MPDPISVLVVDDSEQVRASIKAMLELEEGFLVLGEAGTGEEAIAAAAHLDPDVVLMDINMPGMDGIEATQAVRRESRAGVVMISVQGELDYLRRAMQAGARDYLVKPFTADELVAAIRRAALAPEAGGETEAAPPPVHGRIVTVMGPKGGAGKSLVAANLAAALASMSRLRVAAVDLDLEFGTLVSLFGVRPVGTWLDLSRVQGPLMAQHVQKVMTRGEGVPVEVLAAPPHPHLAAEIDGEGRPDPGRDYVGEVLDLLRQSYDYVIIDTPSHLREAVLAALDRSDEILLVTTGELPALQNTAKALDMLLDRLGYPREKVSLVLNRAGEEGAVGQAEVEKALGYTVHAQLPADRGAAAWGANTGQLLVLRRGRSPLAEALRELAHGLLGDGGSGGRVLPAPPQARERSAGERGGLAGLSGLGRRLLGMVGGG